MTLLELESITLARGSHTCREDGMCAAEAIALLAGEPHSDHPKCLCPTIGAILRHLSDSLSQKERDRLLRPLLPLAVGTADPKKVERRGLLCADWLFRTFMPAWWELVDATRSHAQLLRQLPPIEKWEQVRSAVPLLTEVRQIRDAGHAAAREDAHAGAYYTAWEDAAWDCVRDGVRAAVSNIAWEDATRDAWVTIRAAARDAWEAVRAADRDALQPTVVRLQESAVKLLREMCTT